MAQTVKNLPAMQETQVRSLDLEDPLEKGMATHSNILAWKIPQTEEPGGLQSIMSHRVGHDWETNASCIVNRLKDSILLSCHLSPKLPQNNFSSNKNPSICVCVCVRELTEWFQNLYGNAEAKKKTRNLKEEKVGGFTLPFQSHRH